MAHILNFTKFNNVLVSATLIAFSMNVLTPPSLNAFELGTAINEASLMIRLEKLVERLMKLESKGSIDQMIDLMLDAKSEIENFLGVSFNIEGKLQEVNQEMRKKGYQIPRKQFENLTNKVKLKDKKNKTRTMKMARCLSDPDFSYELNNEGMLLRSKHKHKHDESQEEKEEFIVPVRVAFGVTVALCGLFLVCLPMPPAKAWGQRLIETGILIAVEGGISNQENKEEKNKK